MKGSFRWILGIFEISGTLPISEAKDPSNNRLPGFWMAHPTSEKENARFAISNAVMQLVRSAIRQMKQHA
ncbi:hypothetical protein JRQ81_016427 [Phrynocephalus forsythii]|uniref:Uncharacterized protein n=1 Tax=Phrynocephalus forsythii TaxID=171643 RepID=A0A9Q0XSU6_9SAUR|nr:hypothetical protein JRQ81_016427 [Phrynocephalus forsythii]